MGSLVVFFLMFLKLILFLEDLDKNIKAELINIVFVVTVTENHVLSKEAANKYQGLVSFVKS